VILPPNSRWDLFRDLTSDDDGDTEDSNTDPLYRDIPGVLSYRNRIVMDPDTRTPQQVAFYFLLMPQGTDARNDDRLRETTTKETFNISGVVALPTFGFSRDVSLTLVKVGG
jgi:hypothetical protein